MYTKKELIQIIQDKAKELGRTPKAKEVKQIGSILKYFGTWNNALRKANIPIDREREYTDKQLIQIIQDKAKELGRTPKSTDVSNFKTIILHFGTWNNGLKVAGLKINKKRGYTDKQLLNIIQNKAKELGRPPKTKEIKQMTPIVKHFGNLGNALKKVSLNKIKE